MSAARPPNNEPPIETLDEADLIIDQTAPPQKSPLRGALPFAGPGRPPPPAPSRPPLRAPQPPPRTPQPYGDETAAPQRSPLAEALPFRHAKPAKPEPTMALPQMTPEVLARMTGQTPPSPDLSKSERAKLEQARTVAFAMPPGFGDTPAAPASPAASVPHAAPAPPHATPAPHAAPAPSHAAPASPAALSPPPGASPVPAGGGPVAKWSTGHFGLSIEQYAALCAEVAVFPERGEAIFAQYGLAERKDRMTADLAWQDRLRADNALMARWQGLYLYYHDYYSRLRGR